MDSIIQKLKATDEKDKTTLFYLIIVFFVFIGIYSGISLSKPAGVKDGYAMLVLGFVLALFYFFSGFLKIRKINYNEPASRFVRKAVRRYSFMKPIDWILTTPILALFFTGGYLIVRHSFMKYMASTTIPETLYSIVFATAITVGSWASYKKWKQYKEPLLKEMKKKLEEFEG